MDDRQTRASYRNVLLCRWDRVPIKVKSVCVGCVCVCLYFVATIEFCIISVAILFCVSVVASVMSVVDDEVDSARAQITQQFSSQ